MSGTEITNHRNLGIVPELNRPAIYQFPDEVHATTIPVFIHFQYSQKGI
jgi:hypothetical protein